MRYENINFELYSKMLLPYLVPFRYYFAFKVSILIEISFLTLVYFKMSFLERRKHGAYRSKRKP